MVNKYFNMELIKNKITKLSNVINNALKCLNNKYCIRNRKLDISKLFYFLCYKNENNFNASNLRYEQ